MTNIFRKEYRELSDDEKALLDQVKDKAQELFDLISEGTRVREQLSRDMPTQNGREMALAKTKLEEAVMWAVKGITG